MEVTLLGTGDTTGTPTPNCDCDTCEAARARGVERSRFSVLVRCERTDESLLIDASPDFRQQFRTHDVAFPDAAVVTHVHFDHLDGLGNAYRLVDHLPVHAADETDPETGESVAETVARKYDYLEALSVRPQTPFRTFQTCGLEVTLVPVEHPPLLCYGLVIEDPETGARLSVSGDTNYDVPERSRRAMRAADLLLVDGLVPADNCVYHPLGGAHPDEAGVYRTFGTKHMTIEGARRFADDLEVGDHRLVHLSHYVPAARAFDDDMAVDGERFVL